MKIGKLFEFENAHIVRNCSSKRCRTSIHGHSYKLELVLSANGLDKAAMVYDFGLLKREIKQMIDAFDHTICIWKDDDASYIKDMQTHSQRWIKLPFNVSAEMLAMLFFTLIDALLKSIKTINGEQDVMVHSVKLNETRTGWAQAERSDCIGEDGAYLLDISQLEFSPAVVAEFTRADLLDIAKATAANKGALKMIINPKDC